MTILTAPRFNDADAAREHLEDLHWPNGPVCPHCGSVEVRRLPAQRGRPSKAHPEGAIRKGVIQCNGCRQQFTVTVNTVFADSKVPLNKWLLAVHLLTSSKKGVSSHQLSRNLGVTYKTAWFMAHRIREAMIPGDTGPMGGDGGIVEADETFIGRVPGNSRIAIHNMNKSYRWSSATRVAQRRSFSPATLALRRSAPCWSVASLQRPAYDGRSPPL